jgi:hypothetical protein
LFGGTQFHPNPRGLGGIHLNPSQTTWIGVDLCAAKQSLRTTKSYLPYSVVEENLEQIVETCTYHSSNIHGPSAFMLAACLDMPLSSLNFFFLVHRLISLVLKIL